MGRDGFRQRAEGPRNLRARLFARHGACAFGTMAGSARRFLRGASKSAKDSRFLVERAGAEYRLKEFSSAKKDLLAALRLNPKDDYAEEFLERSIFLKEIWKQR